MANLVSKFVYYSSLKLLVVVQFDTDDASQHIPREEGLIMLVRQKNISKIQAIK
jgi:hypothetical protein